MGDDIHEIGNGNCRLPKKELSAKESPTIRHFPRPTFNPPERDIKTAGSEASNKVKKDTEEDLHFANVIIE